MMNKTQASVHIGTSGWHYDHWAGSFYPDDISPEELLRFYAQYLRTVEINNTFYHLPDHNTFAAWRDTVPEHFIFSVKASRYITHMKNLNDVQEPLTHLLEGVRLLGNKLGPILFQLPPRWHCNHERLATFLDLLPGNLRYSLEFRDPDWFNDQTYELLRDHSVAFCIYDLDGKLSPKEITTDFIYVRLHGPDGPYQGAYDTSTLGGWAGAFSAWSRQGQAIYCYFDNDEEGNAVKNALALQAMFESKGGKSP